MNSAKLNFESRRFVIRPIRISDYESWKQAHNAVSSKLNEFDIEKKLPRELTKPEFRKFLKKNEDFRDKREVFYFGVFEKKTGRMMGHVLLALPLRFNVQSIRISYAIFNNFWKHGYGKEVVQASIDFAFKKLQYHRVEAEIQPHNRASISLAKSLGLQFEGIRKGAVYFNGKWHDHAVYAILAEDRGIKNPRPKIFR